MAIGGKILIFCALLACLPTLAEQHAPASGSESSSDGGGETGSADSDSSDPNGEEGEPTDQEKALDEASRATEDAQSQVDGLGEDGKLSREEADKLTERLDAAEKELLERFGKDDPRIKDALANIERQRALVMNKTAPESVLTEGDAPRTTVLDPGTPATTPETSTPPTAQETQLSIVEQGLTTTPVAESLVPSTHTPLESVPTTPSTPVVTSSSSTPLNSIPNSTGSTGSTTSNSFGYTPPSLDTGNTPIYRPSESSASAPATTTVFSSESAVFSGIGNGSSTSTPAVVSTETGSVATSTPGSAAPASAPTGGIPAFSPPVTGPTTPSVSAGTPPGSTVASPSEGTAAPAAPSTPVSTVATAPGSTTSGSGTPSLPGVNSPTPNGGPNGLEQINQTTVAADGSGRVRRQSAQYSAPAVSVESATAATEVNVPEPLPPTPPVNLESRQSRGVVAVDYGSSLPVLPESPTAVPDVVPAVEERSPTSQGMTLSLVAQTPESRFVESSREPDFQGLAYKPPSFSVEESRAPASTSLSVLPPLTRDETPRNRGGGLLQIINDVKKGNQRLKEESQVGPQARL